MVVCCLLLSGCSSRHVDYRSISWKELASFAYAPSVTPRSKHKRPIHLPKAILRLNGTPLRLSGYMMPV